MLEYRNFLLAAVFISAEAGDKKNPDQPVTTVIIVVTVAATIAAKDTVTVSVTAEK